MYYCVLFVFGIFCRNMLLVDCERHVEMLEKNILAPYRFIHQNIVFHFCFNYAKIEDCLPLILQLHRAASLVTVEQNAMVTYLFFYIKYICIHRSLSPNIKIFNATLFDLKDYGHCTLETIAGILRHIMARRFV